MYLPHHILKATCSKSLKSTKGEGKHTQQPPSFNLNTQTAKDQLSSLTVCPDTCQQPVALTKQNQSAEIKRLSIKPLKTNEKCRRAVEERNNTQNQKGRQSQETWYKFVIYNPWQSPDFVCRNGEGNLPISCIYIAFISSLSSRTAQHRLRCSSMVENLFISTSKERSRSIPTPWTQESPTKKIP